MDHQYTVNRLPHSQVQLIVSKVADESFAKSEKKAVEEFGKELKIDGFRPGHIPENLIREKVSDEYLKVRALEIALPQVINELVKHEKLLAISRPSMEYKSVDPLEVVVTFDVKPEVSLGDYKKIKVEKKPVKVSEQEVDSAIEHMRKNASERKDVERPAVKGDFLEIDFDGFDLDGVSLEGTSSKNHPLILGENTLIPGFEDEFVGLKKDDAKEFEITFPKDYHAKKMASKKVKFKVLVKAVKEIVLPVLDEAFVEKVMRKKASVDEFKKEVRVMIEEQGEKQATTEWENKYFDELLKICKIDVPRSMVEEEKDALLREMKQRILYQGGSFEKYLETVGKSEVDVRESFEKQAVDRVSLQMILLEICKAEKIEVDELEVEAEVNRLVERYPKEKRADIKKMYSGGGQEMMMLVYQLKMRKTLEALGVGG